MTIQNTATIPLTDPQRRELSKVAAQGANPGAYKGSGARLRVREHLRDMGLIEMRSVPYTWPSGNVSQFDRWFLTEAGERAAQ